MVQRSYIQAIKSRIGEKRKFIQVIFGPGQVGKTTTMAQVTKAIKMPFYSIGVKSGAAAKTQRMAAFKKQAAPGKILRVGNNGLPWKSF